MTLYRELKGQNGLINWQIKLKIIITAYTNNKGQAAFYLGVLVGIVGSIDTKAPSGFTIIIAVFLQIEEIKSEIRWIYDVNHWTCCPLQRTSFSTTAGLQNGLRCWLVVISVIYRPRDVGGGTQQFFDITWAAVTTEKHLWGTNKGVLAICLFLSSYLYYNEKHCNPTQICILKYKLWNVIENVVGF